MGRMIRQLRTFVFLFAFVRLLPMACTQATNAIPGLRAVPPAVLPHVGTDPSFPSTTSPSTPQPSSSTSPQQPGCTVPTVTREDFSASQVAFLVAELQQAITPGCYGIVSTSLATCLPDLSLVSGCCTPNCARALRLALTPDCLGQFWTYVCSNGTYFAPHVSGVFNRCLDAAANGLQLTCPVNQTALSQLLNMGSSPGGLAAALDNTTGAGPSGSVPGAAPAGPGSSERDQLYYATCIQEPPRLWPDFNGSSTFYSLLAFAQDVSQDCLRTSLAYLPSCYDDLTYQSGCCSLRCRAAVERVPISCLVSFVGSLCVRVPSLTKYFFNAAQRCANLTLSCQGFGDTAGSTIGVLRGSPATGAQRASALPIVATSTGQCPLNSIEWPNYNAAVITTATLNLLTNVSTPCRFLIMNISQVCHYELGTQTGCCSYACALAMRRVPDHCHNEFRQVLCRVPMVAKYALAMGDRCLGGGYFECPGGQPGQVQSFADPSSTG